MSVAVTGHRPNKLDGDYTLKGPLCQKIRHELEEKIFELKPEVMISGMALGIDMLWAELAVELDIPLIAAIPFKGQELKWPKISQERYRKIFKNPKVAPVIVCDGGYAAWKMQARNEWMVKNANHLIAVFDGTPGGTMNCVSYALKQNVPIHIINPKEL